MITRCNVTRLELIAHLLSARDISGSLRTTKKSNDVFENVTSAPDVSDYDLYARERRLEATDRPCTNCATDFGRHYKTNQGQGKTGAKRYLYLPTKVTFV